MSAKPYYTSNDLVEAVKRKIAMPLTQLTFSDEDILAFANEELFLSQVPSVMQYHEDYFVYSETISMVPRKSRYDIPYRTIGMKLFDVCYADQQMTLRELSLVEGSDKAYFQANKGNLSTPYHFYLENNQIVLTPDIGDITTGYLVYSYYLRPNNLVLNSRAAICQAFTKEITIDNANLTAGDTLTIGSTVFTAGTDFAIGPTSISTATNLNTAINTQGDYISNITSNIVVVQYESLSIAITSSSAGIIVDSLEGIMFDQVPAHIVANTYIDFLKLKGGHRTYKFDVKLKKNTVSTNGIKFDAGVIPSDFEPGDYVCSQYECIIPQIPSDLHNLLAERTCARVLEALGDVNGLQTANAKIGELEARQGTILDNRVEGSPRKVLNRTSLLRYGKGIGFGRTKI